MNTPVSFPIAEILFKKHRVLLSNISDVVMWLYEKHGIWAEVRHNLMTEQFLFEIIKNEGETHHNNEELLFNSPTEAYEAAIEYCLTKLI